MIGIDFCYFGYGEGAFERARYMNVVVQRACHPQLRYYIHATVSGLLPFIQKVGLFNSLIFIFFPLILICEVLLISCFGI